MERVLSGMCQYRAESLEFPALDLAHGIKLISSLISNEFEVNDEWNGNIQLVSL